MVSLKLLRNEEKSVLKQFSSRLRELLRDNLLIFKLFGSRAREEGTNDSDIDIMIVLSDYLLRNKVFDALFSIDPYNELNISPVIYSREEYQKNLELESPFIMEIEKDGISL